MPLGITYADFIYPVGELQPNMFPKENLQAIISTWLAQAETKVASVAAADQDAAAMHWVYYRAYSAIAKRIGASPSRMSFGGNSGGGVESTVDWGQNRADSWSELAQAELDKYHYYVPEVPPADTGASFRVY